MPALRRRPGPLPFEIMRRLPVFLLLAFAMLAVQSSGCRETSLSLLPANSTGRIEAAVTVPAGRV